MLQGVFDWINHLPNFVGAGINGIISLVFIITISLRKENTFFVNTYKKIGFWLSITAISFFGGIWTVSMCGKSQSWTEYYTVFNMPTHFDMFTIKGVESIGLTVPAFMFMAYVLFVIMMNGKNRLHNLNVKEAFIMIYTSTLAADILQMLIFPLTGEAKGIGGIGGGGYYDVLFIVPIFAFVVIGLIKQIELRNINKKALLEQSS